MTPPSYDITLSKEQLQIIGAALGQRPYVEVVHLIAHIEQQIDSIDRRNSDPLWSAPREPA